MLRETFLDHEVPQLESFGPLMAEGAVQTVHGDKTDMATPYASAKSIQFPNAYSVPVLPVGALALPSVHSRCGKKFNHRREVGGAVVFPGRATRTLQEGQVGELVQEVLQGGRAEGLVRGCRFSPRQARV